jgi:hypothetical protein
MPNLYAKSKYVFQKSLVISPWDGKDWVSSKDEGVTGPWDRKGFGFCIKREKNISCLYTFNIQTHKYQAQTFYS